MTKIISRRTVIGLSIGVLAGFPFVTRLLRRKHSINPFEKVAFDLDRISKTDLTRPELESVMSYIMTNRERWLRYAGVRSEAKIKSKMEFSSGDILEYVDNCTIDFSLKNILSDAAVSPFPFDCMLNFSDTKSSWNYAFEKREGSFTGDRNLSFEPIVLTTVLSSPTILFGAFRNDVLDGTLGDMEIQKVISKQIAGVSTDEYRGTPFKSGKNFMEIAFVNGSLSSSRKFEDGVEQEYFYKDYVITTKGPFPRKFEYRLSSNELKSSLSIDFVSPEIEFV